jgi:uncharacterized RDD family membrane protein YckC
MTQSGQPGAPPPGGAPPPPQAPPPPPNWQSTPQPPAPPPAAAPSPMAQQMSALSAKLMDRRPVAGPAGFYYADVPNRAIAFIIDYIIFFVVLLIVGIITVSILGTNLGIVQLQTTASVFVQQVLGYAIGAAYFIYTWTAMRGTIGMKALGMQIGNETDGSTISLNTAAIRYGIMFGPGFVAGLVSSLSLGLGAIASLVSLIWFIALIVTTAQSPTKQGLHDRYAHTMVVKAARSVG